MADQSRTLEVIIKIKDLATKTLSGVQVGINKFADSVKKKFGEISTGALRRIGELLVEIPGRLLAAGAAFLKNADDVQKLSAALGTTSESFQKMAFAAGQSGIAQSEFANTSKFLVKAMEEARIKGGAQREAFGKLGLDVQKLGDSQLDLVDIYARVAEGAKRIHSPTERARVLMTLFGKSGHELALLMEEGGAGIRAIAKDIQDLGGVVSSEAIKNADAVGDEINRIKVAFQGLFNSVVKDFLPKIAKVLKGFADLIKDNRAGIVKDLQGLGGDFLEFTGVLATAFAGVADIFRNTASGLTVLALGANVGFKKIQDGYRDTAESASELQIAQIALSKAVASTDRPFFEYAGKVEELKVKLAALGTTAATTAEDIAKTAKEAGDVAEELQRFTAQDFFKGFKNGVKEFGKSVREGMTIGQQAAVELLQGGQQALAGFFQNAITGAQSFKQAFKSMAVDVLQLLAKLIAEFLAAQAVGLIFGAGSGAGAGAAAAPSGGGAGPSSSGAPTIRRLGRSSSGGGFSPQGGGIGIPGGGGGFVASGGGGGGNTNVNVTIVANDAKGFSELLSRPSSRQTLTDIIVNAVSKNRDMRIAIKSV